MIRIHREGRWLVSITILVLLALLSLTALYLPDQLNYLSVVISLIVLILILRFFRVPSRRPYMDERTITAPADGKVVVIEKMEQDEYLNGFCTQVSIFMSIHDVHINYFPVSGNISYQKYHPGRYLVARHPKSSTLNERSSVGIVSPYGRILVRQVAGYVARRIRCYATEGELASQGSEMGFIKFGSRLDLFLPLDAQIQVKTGQRVTGGVTPIATFK
ncbi:MAG: phosphatidylserine decarboxylase family protein [Bacteroidales bacterium]|nr:phosphatidylserine decarboxylase family protein [Bacteroidales bacterium]